MADDMLHSKRKPNHNAGKRWALLLLTFFLMLSCPVTHAQSPGGYSPGLLPTPQNPSVPAAQELIPVTLPANPGEVVVEEQGAGLISLKVRDASLRQVIAMIAETQRVNIMFSSPEDVRVTGTLNRIPWLQALETILASTGHAWTNDQGTLVVTPLAAVEILAPRAGGRRIETFELDFAKAVDIEQTIQGLLSPAGKSWVIQSSSSDNRQTREIVSVIDFPANLAQIADFVSQVDQPPRQVLIKVNILQVELNDDCRSGVDFEQLLSFSGNKISLSTKGFANGLARPASFLQIEGGSLDALIELLQTTTDAKTLASTELLTVSGQEARLQSGQQLGFRETTTTQTSTLESVKFLDVGVVLSVTPQVTRDGRVLMKIKPEVSEGQVNPLTELPEEDTVEVETNVLLSSGQGLVIGGLIQEVDSNIQSKVPWLGDLPYVGIVFQKRQLIKNRTEIIVTLTPHVLPYTPIGQAKNNHSLMRAEQPLLSAPLNRFPRPYEPRLPDTFQNPTPAFPNHYYNRQAQRVARAVDFTDPAGPLPSPAPMLRQAPTPMRLPPVEPVPGIPMPVTPILQQAPLCYPPVTVPAARPAIQQAAHAYPSTR